MLQGDALSVQLFIGAASLTALSVAMTQAGWTHKWFVGGMFALAALLAVASIGWPYFETRIPRLSDALQVVAASRMGWFSVGIIPAFVGGMLLSDTARRRRETTKIPQKWMSTFIAMETLARQDLIDRYQYVYRQMMEAMNKGTALSERMAELENADPILDEEYAKLRAEKDEVGEEVRKWMTTEETCTDVLRSNIHDQLRGGKLIAKGFLSPHTPGEAERIIPKEEWRFLMLDEKGDQALGPNFEYIALLIGKPGH
jgi:hypothetical protein